MDWTEVCTRVATADTEEASAIANMVVPYGIYIEDYSDLEQGAREIAHIDLIDEELLTRDRSHSIIHLYGTICCNCRNLLCIFQNLVCMLLNAHDRVLHPDRG